VKRALQELAAQNLVRRGRGRGTVIATNEVVTGSLDGLTESVRQSGFATKVDLLEANDVPAPPEVAAYLNLQEGAAVRRQKWRRRIEGRPFSYFSTYVAVGIAEQLGREEMEYKLFAELMQDAGRTHLITKQWISAAAANTEVATALALDIGHPVLKIDRLMHDENGDPIQLLIGYYCSDEFKWCIRSAGAFVGTLERQ
jgi:GntR family transcriptional regulator